MTNEELSNFLSDKSEEFRKGYFAAINSSSAMKVAFLKQMIGQEVLIEHEQKGDPK